MIFFGTKASHLRSENVNGIKCNHCKEQRTHTISIFGKYFYLYWIPIFPLNKTGVSECNHCKVTHEPKQMSEQLKLSYENIKRDTKTPIKHWIGAILIISFLAFIIIVGGNASKQHAKELPELINSPKIGDVIDYKIGYKSYSTLKITRVSNDSIFVVQNIMEISKQRKLYKIDKEENYDDRKYSYGISHSEYENSFKTKKFLDVDR